MSRPILLLSVSVAIIISSMGCRHMCRRGICSSRNDTPPRSRDELLIPPPTGGLPSTREIPSDSSLPPPTVRSEPSGSGYSPRRETLYPDPLLESPAISNKPMGEPPAILSLPETTGSAAKKSLPSAFAENSKTPTGLPGYAVVMDRVATGRKPTIDGFDTLRNQGYRSVVYLHAPAKDISAAKSLADKKGLTFIAISIEPANLKAAYGEFAERIGNTSNRPIYVFDDDGIRTGTLWYLHFRKVESMSDEAAQIRAAPLGLRDASGDEKTNFWLAIQELLTKS